MKRNGLNNELISRIRKANIPASILTNCGGDFSKVLEKENLRNLFVEVVNPTKNRVYKPDLKAYKEILSLIEEDPANCLLIDDSGLNIKAAKKIGLQTFLYEDNKSLFKAFRDKKIWKIQ